MEEADRSSRVTRAEILRDWNSHMNGGLVTTGLALMSAIVTILVITKTLPAWSLAVPYGLTFLWAFISLLIAAFGVAHRERLAHLDAIIAKTPDIRAQITRFVSMDFQELSEAEFRLMQAAFYTSASVYRFNCCVELTNHGGSSRARHWDFIARRENGEAIRLEPPAKLKWSRPASWPDVDYWTFDHIQDEYLRKDRTYRVFIPLTYEPGTPSALGTDLPVITESFRASFKDETGAEIVCNNARKN
jgi:hypothetical protein